MTKNKKNNKKKEKEDFNLPEAISQAELNSYVEVALLSYITENNIKITSKKDLEDTIKEFNNIKNGE